MATKILVVDDEPQLQRLISDWLTEAGYTMFTASNGQEGLKAYNPNPASEDELSNPHVFGDFLIIKGSCTKSTLFC